MAQHAAGHANREWTLRITEIRRHPRNRNRGCSVVAARRAARVGGSTCAAPRRR
jgi:hypothetical protein